MQEHQHVKTVPGEPVSPEIVPHAVQTNPGENTQAENINIPLLIISVLFFAVFLVVAVVSIQAWYYNSKEAQRVAVQAPEGGPGTDLGAQWTQYHHELYDGGVNDRPGYSEGNTITRISIDTAMADIVQRYTPGTSQNDAK